MAVAIGIASCGTAGCFPATDFMGTILYNGKFNPVYHENYQPPYQNFSVTIPSGFAQGDAQINVAHATLVGVSAHFSRHVLNLHTNSIIGGPISIH